MKVINHTKKNVLADNATIAASFMSRIKGLLGKAGIAKGEGLIISDCGSIHTFFMNFPIDVIFLNYQHTVVKIKKAVMPFRLVDCPFTGSITIELPAGTIDASRTEIGDYIELQIA